jgi:nucleoid-associated protein YgaU
VLPFIQSQLRKSGARMGQTSKAIQLLMTIGISAGGVLLGVGCAETAAPGQASSTRGDVTDVRPIPTAMAAAYQPPIYDSPIPTAPQAVTPDPVVVSPVSRITPMISTTPSAKTIGDKTHTVRHGETLFSIAKATYGDGKRWKEIVAANPGLSPSKLKVGQVLMIPQT